MGHVVKAKMPNIVCMNTYEDAVFDAFMKCMVDDNHCLTLTPSDPTFRCSPPVSTLSNFSLSELTGTMTHVAQLDPLKPGELDLTNHMMGITMYEKWQIVDIHTSKCNHPTGGTKEGSCIPGNRQLARKITRQSPKLCGRNWVTTLTTTVDHGRLPRPLRPLRPLRQLIPVNTVQDTTMILSKRPLRPLRPLRQLVRVNTVQEKRLLRPLRQLTTSPCEYSTRYH
ncbi:hypothetical protein DPMN_013729 [Dreissena polymorpha]|uniref:VDE lipocalin domain-containing protein n=1 Tax=Dreissena polymorpha TaxID=45954 RepID=A0A9D4N4R0_DREPO|nr:hypothetical protein DPMN_013729 [Dreissena polymorpha]